MKKKISSLFYGVTTFAMLMCVTFIYSCSKDDNNSTDGGGGGDDIPDDEIVVSEDYMPLEDYEYSVESADTAAGVYTLSFADGTPDVQSGDVVQVDMDTLVKLVRVVSVEDAGGNVTLRTEPADLCDIFISGSFTLSTEGMAEAKTRGAGKSGNVFYPSSITFYDENDRKHTVDFTDGTRGGFDRRLYSQVIDLSGLTLAQTAHTRTYLETCTYNLNLDLIMEYNFEEAKEGWNKYRRGELVMQKSAIRGSIDTDFMIRFDAKYSTAEQLDEICIKPNVHKPITAKFPVGPVVVVVVMNTNLYVEGSYEVEGKFSAYTGFATSTSAELGFSWAQGGSINHYADFPSNFTWHKPTVEGSAHLANKLSVFPRINFSVYGLLGPAFDIKPYLRQTLDLGFYDELGNNPKDFYGATYDMYTGYDAAVALTLVPTMNTETIAKSPSWNVVEKQLYHAPASLEYAGESYSEVEPGKTYAIDFKVRDSNLLTSSEALPFLPWAVKFVTNCGKLSSDFVTTNCFTGLASVVWTPSSSTTDGADPYVVAIIHNNEGREIASDRITTKLEKGKNRTFNVGGVEFTMVYVEGGTFMMGNADPDAHPSERPVHQVTLSDYYIGETEVTQALWQAVMGSNPSRFKGDNLPVEKVSWYDCQDFIGRLNQITGENFSLPTEAQWEFAARGGNYSKGYKYSGSNNPDAVAWYEDNARYVQDYGTRPVATKQPNELGIYDMSGNVWEWCSDWYGSYSSAAVTDPAGPSSGSYRVNLGGSWYSNATNCRCADRGSFKPSNAGDNLGLRLVSQ